MTASASDVTVTELLAHTSWARRLARSLTADETGAEDLLQDAWIAASRRPPATDRPLRPWLSVVLRNLFIKRSLSERRRGVRDAQVEAAGEALSPDVLLEKVEVQRLLAELVASLSEPYRRTVILRYFEDLSSAEIARKLGIPGGTVRWQLKTALDQLKKRLDERHDGRRDRWLPVFLPFASPGRPQGWRWALGIGALGTAAGLAFLAGQAAVTRPSDANGSTTSLQPPPLRAPPPARRPDLLAAAIPVDLGACRTELKKLRAETAAAEAEGRKRLSPKEAFALGTANPAAVTALTPPVERILKGASSAPSHSMECRTWACRLLIAQTHDDPGRTNEWQLPLQRDPEMRERTAGMGFRAGTPTKDPVSGVALSQMDVYLKLADPSGKRMPEPRTPAAVPDASGLPATSSQCAMEIKQLRAQLQVARADIAAHASPMEKFAAGLPNPRLSEELRGKIAAKFPGPETATLALECRDLICQVRWQDGPTNWHNQFHDDPWFRKNIDGAAIGREVYFLMAPQPRADGPGFLGDLVERFDASGAPEACAARFPATGSLRVKFMLPKTGEANENGETGRISAIYGDTLAGTPIGKCMEDEIAKTVLVAPLPSLPVGGAVRYRRFNFPRQPGDAMSRMRSDPDRRRSTGSATLPPTP